MYRYKVKEGHEHRIFVNTTVNQDGSINSDEPLESPYLEAVQIDSPSPAHLAGVTPQNEQPTQSIQSTVSQSEQNTNKVEE